MQVNVRMVAAMVGGLLCAIGAMVLSGGHPQSFVCAPSFLVVAGTAIGALVVLRGICASGRVLRAAFVRRVMDDTSRGELIDTIEVLERTSLVGGFVGVMGGAISAAAAFSQPFMVGPAIHFAFTSLLYCMFFSVFFALPLKHQLLQEVKPDMQLTPRHAVMRTMGTITIVLFALVALSLWRGGNLSMCVSIPSLLFVVAGVGPSALVASDSVLVSPVSERRQIWYSNALLCGGVVAVCFGLTHVMSVLDRPSLVAPGVGWAFASLVLPVAGAVFIRLQSPHERLRASNSDRHGSRNLYFGFAGFAVASLLALMLLVLLCLDNLGSPASPR